MAKCPACGAEIKDLRCIEYGTNQYYFDGSSYRWIDFFSDGGREYRCPECGMTLACSEEEAKKILGVQDHGEDS